MIQAKRLTNEYFCIKIVERKDWPSTNPCGRFAVDEFLVHFVVMMFMMFNCLILQNHTNLAAWVRLYMSFIVFRCFWGLPKPGAKPKSIPVLPSGQWLLIWSIKCRSESGGMGCKLKHVV